MDATTEVRWNVDDIKEDALWLSKKALIDQVSALRLVILERQTRSEHDLLNQFSDEEISSLQDAIEVGQLSHPTGGIQAIEILKGTTRNAQPTESLSQDERRLKIYLLYLSEKRHVLKLALYVLSISLRRELPNTYRRPGTHSQTDSGQQRKMDKLATLVFSPENRTSGSSSTSDISACIEGVRLRLSDIHAASDWLAPEAEYTRQLSLTEEVVQIMQMIFLRLEEVERIPSSQALLSWLRMVAKYDFFDQNSPVRGLLRNIPLYLSVCLLNSNK